MENHPVVSREEWLAARLRLLEKEKEHTRRRDALCAERRALPWVKVERNYIFHGPAGPLTLADLFAGRSQLIVYHFMFGPGWEEGCTGCSFICDHVDGARRHFEHRDVSFVAVSRAPLEEFLPFKRRMGWTFPWVSSAGGDFNYDYHVAFPKEQVEKGEKIYYNYQLRDPYGEDLHGISVFRKSTSGEIFHTYSCYARGGEETLGAFMFMDLTPLGRNEEDTMDWVRHHDRYGENAPAAGCGCGEKEAVP